MVAECIDNLAVVHLLVVIGVHLGEEIIDRVFARQHVHDPKQLPELNLADHAILVAINLLEQVGEFY